MADHHTEQTSGPDQTAASDRTRWRRFLDRLPLHLALTAIGLVWIGGCIWSFEEQTAFARSKGFELPELLPLVVDGMAIAMAAVAWAASLDARPAVFARVGTAIAVTCSSASNAAWAWERSARWTTEGSLQPDWGTVVLAAGIPVVANLAFEVLLGEVRRQVLRSRGLPAPVSVPYPRLVRFVLAPWSTFWTWRRLVLAATDPAVAFGGGQIRPQAWIVADDCGETVIPAPDQRPLPAVNDSRAPITTRPDRDRNARPTRPLDRTATVTPIRPAIPPTQSGPAAVRNAAVLAEAFPDRTPAQKEAERAMGWGAERTRAALAELARMRQTG
jgi:hypothetical protein